MVALMANEGTRPGNRGRQQSQQQQVAEADAVPLLPAWIKEWGSPALIVAGAPALAVLVTLTANHEGDDALALTLAVAAAMVTLLGYSYVRRGKAHQKWRRVGVVKAFLAAISKHDWPEVWKLGGKYIGQGPYSSYTGMVSGYKGTIRDVPVVLKTAGQTVSGQFLAYESDGEIRTYAATYVVRGGVIIHADVHEVRNVPSQAG
jgi:hypothetical protein